MLTLHQVKVPFRLLRIRHIQRSLLGYAVRTSKHIHSPQKSCLVRPLLPGKQNRNETTADDVGLSRKAIPPDSSQLMIKLQEVYVQRAGGSETAKPTEQTMAPKDLRSP